MGKFIKPAFSDHNVPVVVAVSNQYAPYAGVLVKSLLNYATENHNYDIVILTRELTEEWRRLMVGLASEMDNVSIRFYDPSEIFREFQSNAQGEGGKWGRKFPLEVLFRVVAPYFMRDYQKIMTMGADMLVRRDVADLIETRLNENCCLGAVKDSYIIGSYASGCSPYSFNGVPLGVYYTDRCPLKNIDNYVNSDLLLIDVEKYCRTHSLKGLIKTAQDSQFVLVDQDLLNCLFEDKIQHLDPSWNYMVPINHNMKIADAKALAKLADKWRSESQNPWVLHWAGRPKPWVCPDVPYGDEWWSVAQQTPFVGHIIARMIDELQTRREYYQERYGQSVQAWDPMPKVKRDILSLT